MQQLCQFLFFNLVFILVINICIFLYFYFSMFVMIYNFSFLILFLSIYWLNCLIFFYFGFVGYDFIGVLIIVFFIFLNLVFFSYLIQLLLFIILNVWFILFFVFLNIFFYFINIVFLGSDLLFDSIFVVQFKCLIQLFGFRYWYVFWYMVGQFLKYLIMYWKWMQLKWLFGKVQGWEVLFSLNLQLGGIQVGWMGDRLMFVILQLGNLLVKLMVYMFVLVLMLSMWVGLDRGVKKSLLFRVRLRRWWLMFSWLFWVLLLGVLVCFFSEM